MKINRVFNKVSRKGFTLIELLVVIAVLGVLAAILVTAINPANKMNLAKDADIKSDLSGIGNAMQSYYTNTATSGTPYYPAAVSDLVPGELKSEPKTTAGASYTVVSNVAGGCTTAGKTCANIAVYAQSNVTTTNYICWDSTNAALKTSASAPTNGSPTCP